MAITRVICPFCSYTATLTYEENRIYKLKCKECHNTILHADESFADAKSFFERMIVLDGKELSPKEK